MGLRGANDSEMGGDLASNIAMVENIVKKQQQILSEEVNPDLEKVPQSWCLYKEILDYYNEGMRVPENITLLWADDNWGNVRRLPNAEERKRMGGAGVYYHFDYHGGPRSYEWINTNPIAKVWDQMSLAKQYGADKIWIVNVGHFKGYELPMEYFMNLAWNTNEWTNDNINDYTLQWVTREFGPQYAKEIADIMAKYTKFNGRRKIESLSPDTYSVVNYKEAETVVAEYNAIVSQAETLYAKIPKEQRDAFYQIVLFPTKASALVHELYYTAARNRLYDNQRRASTNQMADRTRELFSADTALMTFYNRVYANGRWNHFMDQTHLGYTSWNPPRVNSLNAITLSQINVPEIASLGVAVEGSSASWPGTDEIATLPTFDPFNGKTHYFEIFNRGKKDFRYHISTNVPWLSLSDTANTMKTTDKRIVVSLNETLLPQGTSQGEIRIRGTGDDIVIAVKGFKPNATEQPKGYVESGGCIAIEAEHFSKNTPQGDRKWIRVEDYGLTLSSMRATAPANAIAATPKKDAPCLEYPLYFFTADSATLSLVTSPLLNFMPDRDIRIAVSIDDNEPQYITNVPKDFKINWDPRGWSSDVVNQSRRSKARLKIDKPGFHTLKVWMVDPGVALQKVIIYTGEQKPSYLGPIESSFAK
jgi:hypothetical protein